MKRFAYLVVLSLVAICVLLPVLSACNSQGGVTQSGGDKLVIYNWEDYIDTPKDE